MGWKICKYAVFFIHLCYSLFLFSISNLLSPFFLLHDIQWNMVKGEGCFEMLMAGITN